MSENSSPTNPNQLAPIFIGGCDRSGTTYMGAVLARERGVITLPEADFIADLSRRQLDEILAPQTIAERISGHFRFQPMREAGCADPIALARSGDDLRHIIERVLNSYGSATGIQDPRVFVDHAPRNRRMLRGLADVFPDLKFIHLVRDGRAVAASLMPLDWGPTDIIAAAEFWIRSIAEGFAGVDYIHRELGPAHAITLRYEDLIEGGPSVLARLQQFLGFEVDLKGSGKSGYRPPDHSAETHAIVTKAPDPSRINRWRDHLTARQKALFEYSTGYLLESLGYECDMGARQGGLSAAVPRLDEKIRFGLSRRLNRFRNNRRFQKRHLTQKN